MAKPTNQDEILYCARCGISFLWTREEQKQPNALAPQHCPGCRQLLPAAGRERGLVKWYDRRKHYGFIIRAGKPEIYVHRSAIQSHRSLRPGDLVEFTVEESARGPAAVAVSLVVSGAIAPTVSENASETASETASD
jgi:CspA family cold shock protein